MTAKKFLEGRNSICEHYSEDCYNCPLDDVAICDTNMTIFTTIGEECLMQTEKIIDEHFKQLKEMRENA